MSHGIRDTRIAYGATCMWWDTVQKAGRTSTHPAHQSHNDATKKAKPGLAYVIDHGIPCCPHCGGMLFEARDEEASFSGAREFEAQGHPGYIDFLKWQRGKCFPSMLDAAYVAQGGAYSPMKSGQA